MQINLTQNKKIIKQVLTEPTLWKVMYGQGNELSCFKPDMSFRYLLVEKDNKEIIGLFQIRELTKMLLECHSFILPKYWGTATSKEAIIEGFNWVRSNTTYLKCFTDIPDDCKEVIKASEYLGWKKIGTIENGVIYNNKIQQLHLYEFSLR